MNQQARYLSEYSFSKPLTSQHRHGHRDIKQRAALPPPPQVINKQSPFDRKVTIEPFQHGQHPFLRFLHSNTGQSLGTNSRLIPSCFAASNIPYQVSRPPPSMKTKIYSHYLPGTNKSSLGISAASGHNC